jgi:hypothetical protein
MCVQMAVFGTGRSGHDGGQTPVMAREDVGASAAAGQAVAGVGMRPSCVSTSTWSK